MTDKPKGPNKRAGEKGPNVNGWLGIKFTKERQEEFCNELAKHNLRQKACRAAGVSPDTVSNHLHNDEDFRRLYLAAVEDYKESITAEIHRRGLEGVEEPVYFQGKRVVETDPTTKKQVRVSVRKYDTPLLIMLAKRWIKEFKDKQTIENLNTNVDMGLADLEDLTMEQRAKLKEMIEMEEGEE